MHIGMIHKPKSTIVTKLFFIDYLERISEGSRSSRLK